MAIEILDKGACKAAGTISTDPDAVVCRVQGIQRVLLTGNIGVMRVELTEPIGATELLCLGGVMSPGGPADQRAVQFLQPDPVANPALIEIQSIHNGAAPNEGSFDAMTIWFAFFRIEGGRPEIVPAAPPIP